MQANSRTIRSAQAAPHERLAERVLRHRDHPFRKPFSAASLAAYAQAMARWDGRAPVLLDAGCGVGWSTLRLGAAFPAHFVLGVDRSADRLSRIKPMQTPDNVVFVRADLGDFWRLLRQDGVRLDRHYLLYPNPWPKIGHLARRWHGTAVFPDLLDLGGRLECRSNWAVYVQEMAAAIGLLRGREPVVEQIEAPDPLTPFERKYRDSGHALFRLVFEPCASAAGDCVTARKQG